MQLSGILEGAICLAFIYLLLASIVSALQERIEAMLKTRAVDLERGIVELLKDPNRELTADLYGHTLINGLFVGTYDSNMLTKRGGSMRYARGSTLPSYVPARNFALALIDTVVGANLPKNVTTPPPLTADLLRRAAAAYPNQAVGKVLVMAVDTAQGDINRAQANIEAWYDAGMERVTGWYQRRAQTVMLMLSAIVVVAVNANALTILERLSVDDSLRAVIVAEAGRSDQTAAQGDAPGPYMDKLAQLGLPLGWDEGWPGPPGNPLKPGKTNSLADFLWSKVLHPILGLLISTLAVSMGAPFWFDTLNRLTQLRSTRKPAAAARANDAETPQAATAPLQNPSPAPTPNVSPPQPAPFVPHAWKSGNPQAGVL